MAKKRTPNATWASLLLISSGLAPSLGCSSSTGPIVSMASGSSGAGGAGSQTTGTSGAEARAERRVQATPGPQVRAVTLA